MSVLTLCIVLAVFFLVEAAAFIIYEKHQSKKLVDSIATGSEFVSLEVATMDSIREVFKKIQELEKQSLTENAGLEKKLQAIEKVLAKIPSKTLNTIQGSVNNTSGKLGEMMALLELQQAYDRLIVTNDIVDFIGIKFPTEDTPGCIHFIDVKTGKSAALSQDQRKLKSMFPKGMEHFAFKIVRSQVT